ncbi:uncharacterized protein LOC118468965 [Anopheles albimanus]|uniref:uncharacterized protein LOC118468965 n=1 Tax=Anopheles albimanus TaxID=7167 RepID=UPI00163E30A0|nr:uncharacterized protein LOC118468965 [Anopheles albimanus]
MEGLWTVVVIFLRGALGALNFEEVETSTSNHYLLSAIETHYRSSKLPVHFRIDLEAGWETSVTQLEFVNNLLREQSHWMTVTVLSSSSIGYHGIQNVFLANDYDSLMLLTQTIGMGRYDVYGFYIIVIKNQLPDEHKMKELFTELWSMGIINTVLIVPINEQDYRVYDYNPYDRSFCGEPQVKLLDRYQNGRWNNVETWFRNSLKNLNGCTLRVGTLDGKPFTMKQSVNSSITFVGLEVEIAEAIAERLNFSMKFSTPEGSAQWGVLTHSNSTGLMGMIQLREVDFGFGVSGLNLNRNLYLRSSIPSIITRMSMAIPPKKPYTALEKLLLPFTTSSWMLIIISYVFISFFSFVMIHLQNRPFFENECDVVYGTWVILMGGPGNSVQKQSSRIFMMSLILNAFIVRNMYQSELFTYLRSVRYVSVEVGFL